MKDYHINIFYSPEDEAYVADIPDYEMCSAFGDTPQEALEQILIARDAILQLKRDKFEAAMAMVADVEPEYED